MTQSSGSTALRDRATRDTGRYAALLLMFAGFTGLALLWGEAKAHWDWVDLAGELAALLAVLLWLPFIMAWRPDGRVTDLLWTGLTLLAGGFYLDWLDEFLDFSALPWGSTESLVTPLGLLVLACAFSQLRDEQQVLREQHRRREHGLRDHRAIDPSSGLYDAAYLRAVLTRELDAAADQQSPVAHLALLSLDGIETLVRSRGYGLQELLLGRVAQLLLASAPPDTLVCRYAGHCFVVAGPDGEALGTWTKALPDLLRALLDGLALNDPDTATPVWRSVLLPVMPGKTARAILRDALDSLPPR